MSRRCLGCMETFGEQFEVCPHCGYIVGTEADEAIHMQPGTLLHDNRYRVGKVLGYGGFGVTYIGWDELLEQKVAIKEYFPGEFSTRMPGQSQVTAFGGDKAEQFRDGMEKFVEEAKRLAKFQNERGIVKVFDSFTENLTAYIIMEFLEGETLANYLKRERKIPEDKAVEMLLPVIHSLQIVHEEGILHRDISPDNIFLLNNGEVKLIDFGASRYATTSHSRSLTVIIKPGYSPEEQYRSRGDQGAYTDVYALGAVLYKMITGVTPPDAMERRAKCENQNKDILEIPHKLVKGISENRENAILNAMNVQVEDRTPDVATFLNELTTDKPVDRRRGKIKRNPFYGWPLWAKIAFPAALALSLIFSVLVLTGVIRFQTKAPEKYVPANVVTVPDVVEMEKDTAYAAIENANLRIEQEDTIYSEYVQAGKVVRQYPIGGNYLDKNSVVIVILSGGAGLVEASDGMATMPYIITDTKETALEKLKRAGFAEPRIKEVYDNSISAGRVISCSLDDGEMVAVDTVIEVVISLGAAGFEMTDVEGMEYQTAQESLEALGLKVSIEYEKSDTVNENLVISQSISGGTAVKSGDSVVLTVSSGKNLVEVPNVVGKPREEAKKVLTGQGFKVNILENFSDSVPAGNVISQSLVAGSAQISGSTVTIYVSKGSSQDAGDSGGGSSSSATVPEPEKAKEPFSAWVDSLPDGVTESKYDINKRTLYSSRSKTTTTSSDPNLGDGWTLDSSESSYSEYGPWSDWSDTAIAGSDTVEVEQNTLYRYKKESGDWSGWSYSNEAPEGAAVETKNVWHSRERSLTYTYKYSKWSDWSDYGETAISASTDVEVQTKTQYQYRKK